MLKMPDPNIFVKKVFIFPIFCNYWLALLVMCLKNSKCQFMESDKPISKISNLTNDLLGLVL